MEEKITPAALNALAKGDLENFTVALTPGGIERQEAEGQKWMVTAGHLPKDCPRQDLESLGFVFGKDVDDLFVSAVFPSGWSIKPTEHSMHSDLVDDLGRKRGGIFYKAAFYDRKASLGLYKRYHVHFDYVAGGSIQFSVKDNGAVPGEDVLFSTKEVPSSDYAEGDLAEKSCRDWLDRHHPNWQNPLAYWENK